MTQQRISGDGFNSVARSFIGFVTKTERRKKKLKKSSFLLDWNTIY